MPDDDYKFPHEIEENESNSEIDIDISAEDDVSIEIEDDTVNDESESSRIAAL